MKKAETNIKQHAYGSQITRKDICYMLLLAAATLVFVFILTIGNRLYGSEVDWVSQHSVLPEYFRQQYYETGKLLPEFAAHLGGGQNIFHFSYYGLLSPVILPSYLLPGVSMTTYLAVTNVLLLLASGALCYIWLRRHCISTPAVLAASFLFQFSAAMLYHSHKQIMFVSYMPFLLLALIGTDHFFERRKSGLMMTGVFLMTMTSYFYSIGGLLALTVYGIYIYYNRQYGKGVKNFLLTGISFAFRLIIPVGMSALLLLPSLAAILNGRSGEAAGTSLASLLVPKMSLLNLLYSPYGIGLTALGVLSAFRLISRNRPGERILFSLLAVLFSIPFFLYMLNGGLYLRGKVFIPFLPVMILIAAFYLEEILALCRSGSDFHLKQEIFKTSVICLILLVLDRSIVWLGFTAECALILLGFYHGIRKRSFFLCCFPSLLVCLGVFLGVNFSDPLVSEKDADALYAADKQALLEKLNHTSPSTFRYNDFTETEFSSNMVPTPNCYRTSLYSSTYDADYNSFHSDGIGNAMNAGNSIACFDSNNILFQTFMGVKYLLTTDTAPAGYGLTAQEGPYKLYENKNVFPLAWGSSSLMGKEEYETLSRADQNAALLNYIIVDNAPAAGYSSPLTKETLDLGFPSSKDGSLLNVSLDEDTTIEVPASAPLNERLQMLSFSFDEEPEEDIVIDANGITNLLTGHKEFYPNNHYNFQYVISENTAGQNLKFRFSKGDYSFTVPELYSMDIDDVRRASEKISPLNDSGLRTDSTVLKGTITMENEGYFTASIPYDKGFTALVDGKKQTVESVNTAFIGFPLSAGTHEIKLIYHAPLLLEGKNISAIFFLLYLTVMMLEMAEEQGSYSSEQRGKRHRGNRPAPALNINAS